MPCTKMPQPTASVTADSGWLSSAHSARDHPAGGGRQPVGLSPGRRGTIIAGPLCPRPAMPADGRPSEQTQGNLAVPECMHRLAVGGAALGLTRLLLACCPMRFARARRREAPPRYKWCRCMSTPCRRSTAALPAKQPSSSSRLAT